MSKSTVRKQTRLSKEAEAVLDELELRFDGVDRDVLLKHALKFLRWAHEEVAPGKIESFLLLERPGKRPVDISPMVLNCTGWSAENSNLS